MAKFFLQRAVRHGDKRGKIRDFEAGKIIDLEEDEAAPLVSAGAVTPVEETKEPAKG